VGTAATVTKDEGVSGLLGRGRAVGDPGAVSSPSPFASFAGPEIYQKSGALRLPEPVPVATRENHGTRATALLESLDLRVGRALDVTLLLYPTRCPMQFSLHEPADAVFVRDDRGNIYPLVDAKGIDEKKGTTVAAETNRRILLSFAPPKPEARTISITTAFDYSVLRPSGDPLRCFSAARNSAVLSGQSLPIKLEDFK
jgi:hypothetical protein